ncbi:damage-control phosphatase ARMT1-like isoform X2 [Arctopsyche grandis]|uniref:damage-control phosphatase ARMT1-like isoform X2 n=1 Tax=Arctopsyche grandis TaxID=121162 RepID=UPI00406D8A96
MSMIARDDVKKAIGFLSKLKNEIQTNKRFQLLLDKDSDVNKWNDLIAEQQDPYYFTAIWLFTECYVYRRIREAFEITKSLNKFDPFRVQKDITFGQSLEAMCLVANHLSKKLEEINNIKENFIKLLRMTLWGNKCDLSLSAGEDVSQATNPMAMVDLWQDNLISDDSNSVYDALINLVQCSEGGQGVLVDIVCDNAGYELFVDLCFADFLITKKIASKIRFRVKAIPWFVSDVLVRDFIWTIDKICSTHFKREITSDFTLDSLNLNAIGVKWKQYVDEGIWSCQSDEFWTLPHEFFKMKDQDNDLYKSLGEAAIIFFKGDLNYRKLMGEMNWPPTTSFEHALRGFFPAPLVAVRTVKADLISGLPPGKMEELNEKDNQWMEKGDYGVIQYCSKKDS